jgi:hypothetical protein
MIIFNDFLRLLHSFLVGKNSLEVLKNGFIALKFEIIFKFGV